jgi:radical SAM superfamily enzyme YgiQ (UPF0313 family)
MKVLFVACPFVDEIDGVLRPVGNDAVRALPPLGLYQLAAVVRGAGHDVAMADLTAAGTTALPSAALDGVDVVCVSATTMAWPLARLIAAEVRCVRPEAAIVAGGVHPTMFDRWVLDHSAVDVVVRGEGEDALVSLLAALASHGELSSVPGLSWRDREGRFVRNPVGRKLTIAALAAAPPPAWALLPVGAYRGIAVETSRGCAYDCSFCSTPFRRSWRALPPEAVADRFEAAAAFLGRTTERSTYIVDDEFTLQPRRVVAIVREVEQRGLLPRVLFEGRAPDLTGDEILDALAPHTLQLLVGAECGYDEGLERVGKGTTCAGLEACAAALARHGIAPRADFSFIIGLPWETAAEARRTVAFGVRLGETYGVRALFNWYLQVPGSRLWDEARAAELVHEAQYDEVGFVANLALFRSGVALRPHEVWEVTDEIADHAARLGGRWRNRIEFGMPPAIARSFPRDAEPADGEPADGDMGLPRLRELAHVGLPQRRITA